MVACKDNKNGYTTNISHGEKNLISAENRAPSISTRIAVYLPGVDYAEQMDSNVGWGR
jgi:hypothetical protein